MDKANLYIQKLIILILVAFTGLILHSVVKTCYLLPALFFTLSFLVSRVSGQKPDFLFGLVKSNEFLDKKNGFWVLFKWILILLGLVFDIAAWTLFGVYILFTIILDFILLVKTVIYWIIHAIIWVLKLFVPPLVFIYKMVIFYIFRWNWWIYKISFKNAGKSLNRNYYFISLWGAVLMLFVFLLFYGVGILLNLPEIAIVGAVFALLPLVWSYGEISSLRFRDAENDSYQNNRRYFKSGFDAVRAILSYFIIFLLLALTEVLFNILGWIPQIGFSFMGLALNINSIASLLILIVFVILLFAKFIMPAHVVYNKDFSTDLNGSLNFLGVIGKRFLRYLISIFPSAFFAAVVAVIPAFIVFLSIIITLNVKNTILETRINILKQRVSVLKDLDKYKAEKNIDRLVLYKNFPKNVLTDFGGIKLVNKSVKNLDDNIVEGEKEINRLSNEFSSGIDTLNKKMDDIKSRPMVDSASSIALLRLEALKHSRIDNFAKWKEDGEFSISKMKVDKADKNGLLIQLPFVFLLTIVWASFFIGLVLAFFISYLGNVYFELYNFREDDEPIYFRRVLTEMNIADQNQPLLGFTLIGILIIAGIYSSLIIKLFSL